MARADRKSSNELPLTELAGKSVKTRLRADGILHMRLKSLVDTNMIASMREDLDRHLDGPQPIDWLLDFTGVTGIAGRPNEELRVVFAAFKAHANGRHAVAIVNDATRLLVTTSGFGANLGASFVESPDAADEELARRRGGSPP